jgi:predicted RNA methylase
LPADKGPFKRPFEFDKKQWLFTGGFLTRLEPNEIKQLQTDPVALFSITPAPDADIMSDRIARLDDVSLQKLGRLPVITDGCACVGGNVISFACSGRFSKVNAVEFDGKRCDMLKHNVSVIEGRKVSPPPAPTSVMSGSCLDRMHELHQDIVFLDPPWGGPKYKDAEKVPLYLGDRHLADIVADLSSSASVNGTRYVVFKAPKNFDLDDMCQQLGQKTNPRVHPLLLRGFTKMDLYSVHLPESKRRASEEIDGEGGKKRRTAAKEEATCIVAKEEDAIDKPLQLDPETEARLASTTGVLHAYGTDRKQQQELLQAAHDDADSTLPPGWAKQWSTTWKKHYWFNSKTGKKSWEHPACSVDKEEDKRITPPHNSTSCAEA